MGISQPYYVLSAESGLWVPVWPGVRLDDVHLCCQHDLQHHVPHHYSLWWVSATVRPQSFPFIYLWPQGVGHLCPWRLFSRRNLTLLCCLPVRRRLWEFAAVRLDTQTSREPDAHAAPVCAQSLSGFYLLLQILNRWYLSAASLVYWEYM